MKLLALTGNMGSGKTTVSLFFKDLGCYIIQADNLTKKVSEKKETLIKLSNTFGKEILNLNHTLNKKKLSQIAFSSNKNLQKLNHIMHPEIKMLFLEELEKIYTKNPKSFLIYEIPLLFELKQENRFQKIILVYSNLNLMVQRKVKQTNLTKEEIEKRLSFQISSNTKKNTDYKIENNTDLNSTKLQVEKIFKDIQKIEDLNLNSIKTLLQK